MPYDTISSLPESVKDHLPTHAKEIYKEAFNNSYQEYKNKDKRRNDSSREEVAHKVAWAAVKKKYKKNTKSGKWELK